MKTLDEISFADGYMESILITATTVKMKFRSWEEHHYNITFNECYYIKCDCYYIECGGLSITKSHEKLIQLIGDYDLEADIPQIYTFYDSWDDKEILVLVADNVDIIEC
jgi:hypothetical protein